MSFSPDVNIPFHKEMIESKESGDLTKYMRELITTIQDEFRSLRRDVDGFYSWSENTNGQGEYWQPFVYVSGGR